MTTVMIVHSTCGSRLYIGTYIHDCMISDNNCFYYNQLFVTNRFILSISITASYRSKVYIGMYIPHCTISFYYNK